MKKLYLLCFALMSSLGAMANPCKITIKEAQVPILIEREDNVLMYVHIADSVSSRFDRLVLQFDETTDLSTIHTVTLYYSGTDGYERRDTTLFYPVSYITSHLPGNPLKANPSYSVVQSTVKPARQIVLSSGQQMVKGANYFWVSVRMKPKTALNTKIGVKVKTVSIGGVDSPFEMASPVGIVHRVGRGVRHAGDDAAVAYRIPGLVTTLKGSLLACYDVRYNNSKDLQDHIDIGLSRSCDGGRTWEKMRIPLAFGQTEGLPSGQNGVGDPSILVDAKTGTVWIVAAWTFGMGNTMAWWNSTPGIDKFRTAQLVLARSDDDGKTWSEPINITEQVKDPSWYFLLQGPGRGITTRDGTLVFPIQYIDSQRIPNAGIMYSKDRGTTWHIHSAARSNTTESQVAELPSGELMLNMRDNRGGSRAVCVTSDLGRSWTEHTSSRSALQEPVCMASLISVPAAENATERDLLIFSNPDSKKTRDRMTIKVSLDNGVTWKQENQILLDEEANWGYSCLSMVDKETLGILYESSAAHMVFQAIPLRDLVK